MKKLLTFALFAVVGVASAASINWGASAARNTYVWDSDGNKFNGTAYLVLADDVATILAPTETQTFQDLLGDNMLDSASLSNGAYKLDDKAVASDKLVDNGTKYDFQVILVDANGNYKITGIQTEAAYTPGENGPRSVGFGDSDFGASRNAPQDPAAAWNPAPVYQGGSGTIPEPATGALALAGVALLFKRRRA